MLREILARKTRLPILELEGPTAIAANHVYLPHPGVELTLVDGVLHTTDKRA